MTKLATTRGIKCETTALFPPKAMPTLDSMQDMTAKGLKRQVEYVPHTSAREANRDQTTYSKKPSLRTTQSRDPSKDSYPSERSHASCIPKDNAPSCSDKFGNSIESIESFSVVLPPSLAAVVRRNQRCQHDECKKCTKLPLRGHVPLPVLQSLVRTSEGVCFGFAVSSKVVHSALPSG